VIIEVPPVRPVTTPDAETVATAMLLLLQVPPDKVLLSVVVPPTTSAPVPAIAGGLLLTVTIFVTRHPPAIVYEIVTFPPLIPVTIPEVDPTVPTDIPLLLQVPPGVELANAIVEPTHTDDGPVIALGVVLTDTTLVLKQPVVNVNVILAVPTVTPDTEPVVETVAIATELLDHVPLPAQVKTVVFPTQTALLPEIAPGLPLTVTITLRKQPVPAVYVILTVPTATPETTPLTSTVANAVFALDHVPPPGYPVRVVF